MPVIISFRARIDNPRGASYKKTGRKPVKNERENYEELKGFALQGGAGLFGVAETAAVAPWIRYLSPQVLAGLDRAVSASFRLAGRVLEDVEVGPTRLYFFHYQRVNILLDELALKIANRIQSRGWQALPIPASQIIDWQNQFAHISHKHAARAAGLGWIGRNNLLVSPSCGSHQRLITVLTDMPLPADSPFQGGCGDCRACIASCPSGSIKERPEDFDHRGCHEQIKVLIKKAGISQNICGLCVKACKGRAASQE